MTNGYHIGDQAAPHFLTFTIVDWVDIFTRKKYRDLFLESLKFCQKNKGLELYAFVIMSNHVHLIIQSKFGKLSDLVRDFKKYTARNIIDDLLSENSGESRSEWMLKRFEFAARSNRRNSDFQLWKYGNRPMEIYSEPFLWQKINYIHMNPVRAGWVKRASEYMYSSASNFVGITGILDFELPSIPIIDSVSSKSIIQDIENW